MDSAGWLNDIALIRLKRTIPSFSDSSRPVCLPQRSFADMVALTNITQCYLAGWGYTKEAAAGLTMFRPPMVRTDTSPGSPQVGSGSDILLLGSQYYIPLATCQQNYYTGGMLLQGSPQFVKDNMVCASNDWRHQGACLGDSGGGLYCRDADHNWVVQGVSSWSGGCARKDLPSVFANVFRLKSFIERVIGS